MEKALKSLLVVGIAVLMVASAQASLTFVGIDTTTQGNWIGKYGSAGYDIWGVASNMTGGLKDTSLWDNGPYAAAAPADNQVAIQGPTGGRFYNCKWGTLMFEISLDLGDTPKQVAFYMDFGGFDSTPRALTAYTLDHQYTAADMYDFQTTTGIDAHSFVDGQWLVYQGTGHVDLKFIEPNNSYNHANISAVMIDAVPEPATMSLLALGGIGALLRRRK